MKIALIILILSIASLLYTYLIYPLMIALFSSSKENNHLAYGMDEELPIVKIFMSVFNEASVIEEKIHSVYETSYPKEKLQFYIGSDCSNDKTQEIIENLQKEYRLTFVHYENRGGKAQVLNKLFEQFLVDRDNSIVILTDANVLFTKETIFELTKHFKNERIGQVAANILNHKIDGEVGKQEKQYIQTENKLKYEEGKLWGTSMGAFGACYAIREHLIPEIPQNYLMEDFYISMHVLKMNYKSIVEQKAVCYEDIPGSIQQEFRRKKRIAAGNFQNLSTYYPLLFKKPFPIGFTFFSHKILRWMGPFLLVASYVSCAFLYETKPYSYLFIMMNCTLLIALIDWILKKVNIHFYPFRLIRYFFSMNIAVFLGFIMYLKGVKTNAWQPTKRNAHTG